MAGRRLEAKLLKFDGRIARRRPTNEAERLVGLSRHGRSGEEEEEAV